MSRITADEARKMCISHISMLLDPVYDAIRAAAENNQRSIKLQSDVWSEHSPTLRELHRILEKEDGFTVTHAYLDVNDDCGSLVPQRACVVAKACTIVEW